MRGSRRGISDLRFKVREKARANLLREFKKYRAMAMDMCGSLDIAREASRSGNTKRLSHHTETSGYEAHLHETDDNDSEDDDRQLVELLVNRLSRKKVSGNRPASSIQELATVVHHTARAERSSRVRSVSRT